MTFKETSSPTITNVLFPYLSRDVCIRLEAFRLQWEEVNGVTDLTKYYSSRWPRDQQVALIRRDFQAYVRALPLFFVDWIDRDLHAAVQAGPSSEISDKFICLFNLGRSSGNPHSP